MAVTPPATSTAPTAPAIPAPSPARVTRRELARADVQAELTKLLMHGYGSMLIKLHDHRITSIECTTRHVEGQAEEG